MKNRTHERLVFATKSTLSVAAMAALFIAGLVLADYLLNDPYYLAAVGIIWGAACLALLGVLVDRAHQYRPTRRPRRNR